MSRVRIPGFCLNRIRPHVRVRSPPIQSKTLANSDLPGSRIGSFHNADQESSKSDEPVKPGVATTGRKIMIVVDSSVESKNAIQWALTHTVQSQDLLLLLHLAKPSKQGDESGKMVDSRIPEFLGSMKDLCQLKRPEVKIEVTVAEGKEKGPTIVEEARKQGVALLVLGQKKRSITWRLLMVWVGNPAGGNGGGVVEYCIQNATCMALAVRRKSKRLGGYLITTKRHKDFWLLA